MKIRTGFVSNSSSSSFCIPCCLLTDEQKEILLFLGQNKEEKKEIEEKLGINFGSSDNNYSVNEEYHKIYQKMIDDGEWNDWDWNMSEDKEDEYISGSASMWNGAINILIKKIGIPEGSFEITNCGHNMVHMATHPEAVKFFINMHKRSLKQFEEMDEEKRKTEIEFGHIIPEKSPYELPDKEFGSLGKNTLQFEAEDDFSYVKDKVVENEN